MRVWSPDSEIACAMGDELKSMRGEATRAAEPLFFKGKSFKVERKARGGGGGDKREGAEEVNPRVRSIELIADLSLTGP